MLLPLSPPSAEVACAVESHSFVSLSDILRGRGCGDPIRLSSRTRKRNHEQGASQEVVIILKCSEGSREYGASSFYGFGLLVGRLDGDKGVRLRSQLLERQKYNAKLINKHNQQYFLWCDGPYEDAKTQRLRDCTLWEGALSRDSKFFLLGGKALGGHLERI